MMKIALAVSAAATLLAAAPTVTPAKALKTADGVDVQIGRDRVRLRQGRSPTVRPPPVRLPHYGWHRPGRPDYRPTTALPHRDYYE